MSAHAVSTQLSRADFCALSWKASTKLKKKEKWGQDLGKDWENRVLQADHPHPWISSNQWSKQRLRPLQDANICLQSEELL